MLSGEARIERILSEVEKIQCHHLEGFAEDLSRAITELVEAFDGALEERLQERDREMKLEAWRRLSARTAHRVGNQLFAARGAVRALAGDVAPKNGDSLSDIQRCLDRIGILCAELKRFSAEQAPNPKAMDVAVLVQDVVRRLTGSAEGIELRASVPSLLPECRWDGQQIDQAMTELLENAIRHTPKGKEIEVAAEPFEQSGKQWVRVTVRNDGPGIEQQYKDRIFEPFFSLRAGGTGLGLAIVWQIVKNHKGSIRETGEPGRFARFVIELPARPFEERSDESPGD